MTPVLASRGFLIFLTLELMLWIRAVDLNAMGHQEKISASLRDKFTQSPEITLQEQEEVEDVIVELHDSPGTDTEVKGMLQELEKMTQMAEKNDSQRETELVHGLQMAMTSKLTPAMEILTTMNVPFETLWATREVFIPRASWNVVERMAEIGEVKTVRSPGIFNIKPPNVPGKGPSERSRKSIPWNLALSDARCLDIGCLGQGVVVGFIDTGARVTHQEIRKNWIGMPYGFYDGAHPTVNCTARDDDGHGTHLVGTAVGSSLGVAPAAKWMMCMGCTYENCSEAAVKICGQYLMCPWKCGDISTNKVTKDCSRRPAIISNSWGMTTRERLIMPDDFYYPIVEIWNALGIISIFAAGNSGPTCNTILPPGSYDIVLSVGAVDRTATIPYFSSIGPQLSKRLLTKNTTASGTCKKNHCTDDQDAKYVCSLIKPDIVAAGVHVNSSFIFNDTSYIELSGTSMATPFVAGVVALMKCANRHLRWNYKLAYKLLTSTVTTDKIDLLANLQAKDSRYAGDTNLMCNVVLSNICNKYPNNLYGHGLVNACEAVKATKKANMLD